MVFPIEPILQRHSGLDMEPTRLNAPKSFWIRTKTDMPWLISFESNDVAGFIHECMSDWRLGPRLDGIPGCRLTLTTACGIQLRIYDKTIVELLLEHPTMGSTPMEALILFL